jgi:hypothetical protein
VLYNYLVNVLHPAMIVLYFPDVHHGPVDIFIAITTVHGMFGIILEPSCFFSFSWRTFSGDRSNFAPNPRATINFKKGPVTNNNFANVTGGCVFTDPSGVTTFHVRKYCGTKLTVSMSAKAAYAGSPNKGHNWASQWLKIATVTTQGNLVVHDGALRQFLLTINRVPEIRDDGTRNFDVKLFGQPSFQPIPLDKLPEIVSIGAPYCHIPGESYSDDEDSNSDSDSDSDSNSSASNSDGSDDRSEAVPAPLAAEAARAARAARAAARVARMDTVE